MADAEDWDDLRSEWVGGVEATPVIDVETLLRRVRRATRRTVLTVALEVVIVIAALGLVGYVFAVRGTLGPYAPLGFALMAFCVGASIWARRGPWPRHWETLEELAVIAQQRARAGIRYSLASYWVAAAAMLMLVVVGLMDAVDGQPFENVWVLAGCTVYVAVVTIWNRYRELQHRSELGDIEALLAQLNDTE